MNNFTSSCTYRFIESSIADISTRTNCDIIVRQQPERGKESFTTERDRRSIEPPPILQLHWEHATEEELKKCLQSPFYFMVANLVTDHEKLILPAQDYLSGSTVSSLHRLRDLDNSDGGFFVFGDLAVKKEGRYRLQFSLFEIVDGQIQNRKVVYSDPFIVFSSKQFPGPVEATFLSRAFSDQGVRIKIRKEHRIQSTDVFFGKWQATTDKPRQVPIANTVEDRGFTTKFRHEPYTFPSPESTAFNRKEDNYSSAASSPRDNQRLPTPPCDQNTFSHWGTRLPPLRAIMNDDYKNLSAPLILPPPSSFTPNYVIEPYPHY
ncbi:hypothetical protein G6F56_008674 [Rhizopus delemar]|nr:hypothetical protein G6F56_008674 [Rhizopus delemar]